MEEQEDGEGESALRHVAKVFLVDGGGQIRNVYSSGFLDADLLIRDLETLLGEHTRELLRQHGYRDADIDALARDGVVGCAGGTGP